MRDLSLTLLQADTRWHDPAGNRAMYGELIARAPKSDLIVLPETFLSGFSNAALHQAETMDGISVRWLAEMARQQNCTITGSLLIREGEQVFNRLIWMPPDAPVQFYDKRHLFRMAKEHERYGAGSERLIVTLAGWKICPLVCYDLRFPVFCRNRFATSAQASRDYDVLLFVANWPSARRLAWQTLLRARAIENLAYCVGVNRVGTDGNDLHYAGDSAVLDFSGSALIEASLQSQMLHCVLSFSALQNYRARFPAYLDADQFRLENER
jgi:omega-amidase